MDDIFSTRAVSEVSVFEKNYNLKTKFTLKNLQYSHYTCRPLYIYKKVHPKKLFPKSTEVVQQLR